MVAVDNIIHLEAKASALASSLADNRPAKRGTEALSVFGGGGRKKAEPDAKGVSAS